MRYLVVVALGLLPLTAQAPTYDPATPENRFANTYNAWLALHSEDVRQGTVDARAIRLWKDVKKRLHDLDRSLAY